MTKSKDIGRGGKRAGAGRPLKVRKPPSGPIDPETVLHEIAGDPTQPAAPRVAAARALLTVEREKEKPSSGREDATARALEILRRMN